LNLPKTAEMVIIGGGVMGASIAYHLVTRGQKDVLLLEREEFLGQGATGRCAGGVRYQFATDVNIRLSQASLPMLEIFEDEIGQPINFRKVGYLFLLTREEDVAAFRDHVRLQHLLGVNTQWLNREEIVKCLPMMRLEDVLAGTYNDQEGIVDPNSVVMGYIKRARGMGLTALTEVEVTGLHTQGGKVLGLETSSGDISTPIVINAAGPWAGIIGEMTNISLPIVPIRRQWLTTTPIPKLPNDFPFVIDFAQSLYFHPEGEGLLTGMSNPGETIGFDQSVDRSWELEHLESASARLPLLEKAGVASRWAGLYEVTPDAHPIYGTTPIEGFYICAGFSGHGFMHGPISGQLMSEIILDGEASSVDVSMLDLARFEEDRLIYEYNVV
jgi:sarcosine oxidase subunit beta